MSAAVGGVGIMDTLVSTVLAAAVLAAVLAAVVVVGAAVVAQCFQPRGGWRCEHTPRRCGACDHGGRAPMG